jgi:hypothetical protein
MENGRLMVSRKMGELRYDAFIMHRFGFGWRGARNYRFAVSLTFNRSMSATSFWKCSRPA